MKQTWEDFWIDTFDTVVDISLKDSLQLYKKDANKFISTTIRQLLDLGIDIRDCEYDTEVDISYAMQEKIVLSMLPAWDDLSIYIGNCFVIAFIKAVLNDEKDTVEFVIDRIGDAFNATFDGLPDLNDKITEFRDTMKAELENIKIES